VRGGRESARATTGRMIDLGTFGGTSGWPYGLNNRGQVIGQSNLAGDVDFHAFLWERGVLKDLGTLGGNKSSPRWINEKGEVVGRADIPGTKTRHGFLGENGGPIVDLQTLVLPGSDVTIKETYFIDDAGEIAGFGSNFGGDERATMLIPCDGYHPGVEGCDYDPVELNASAASAPAQSVTSPKTAMEAPASSTFASKVHK
jgi:probable HAF family extracellular repeat protein